MWLDQESCPCTRFFSIRRDWHVETIAEGKPTFLRRNGLVVLKEQMTEQKASSSKLGAPSTELEAPSAELAARESELQARGGVLRARFIEPEASRTEL